MDPTIIALEGGMPTASDDHIFGADEYICFLNDLPLDNGRIAEPMLKTIN